MFESLGVGGHTLAVYRGLLEQPTLARRSRLDDLCAQLDLSDGLVNAEFERLRDFGLLVPRWNAPDEEYPLQHDKLAAGASEGPDQPFLERGVQARYLVAEAQMKNRIFRDGYLYYFSEYGAKVRTAPSLGR